MAQSYKVFFKDRVIFLTDQIDDILGGEFNTILKYANQNELKQFIENFHHKQHLRIGYIYYHDTNKLLELFKKQFIYLEAAGGLVTNNKSEFLAIERLGVYDLPKGKAEKDETPEATAHREIYEECGIVDLAIRRPLPPTFHTYEMDEKLVLKKTHWFHMHTETEQLPTPQTTENITVAKWMKITELDLFAAQTYSSIKDVVSAYQNASV
ncbi:MAG: NUDIX domain-containing protein [Marinilabiliaceae bacterium]|nr:NUDIX domain-containing protein [Marinilabiliaceae bacterium]